MVLSDVSIKRPVFATMVILALVVVGLFSFSSLGLDLFPKIDFPTITISTSLPGTSPEEMENQVTKVIEEGVNTISGIDELRSQTFEGVSQVIVSFVLEKNVDVAAQEVRDRVSRLSARLPQGVNPPIIEKIDPDAAPVMSISLYGPLPLRDLTFLARKQIKEPLESINGVGAISIVGGRERQIHIWLDPDKLNAYGLSVAAVRSALRSQNVEIPGGRVDQGTRELTLRTMGRVEAVEGFSSLVVATRNGVPVRISDIARVEDGEQEPRSMARLDGRNSVSLIVQKQSGVNTVDVVEKVRARLGEYSKALPAGVSAEVIRDQSTFIQASVHTVEEHLVFGAILASLVVFLFLRNWRSTLIVSLAIPCSLIATFAAMKYLGFTLNNMTLLGLTVSVGIVIDDAIVVLENIFRHIEEKGETPMRAASVATQEIGLAVMATTLSLVIIFLPVAFMTGVIGRFLNSYGLTVAFAVMVSLFFSFTLTPMLASRFLKITGAGSGQAKGGGHTSKDSGFYRAIDRWYTRILTASMRHRGRVLLAGAACIVAIPILIRFVGFDFFPPDDQNEFQIGIKAPDGYSLAQTDKVLQRIEADIQTLPHVERILTSIGEGAGATVSDASVYVRLTPLKHGNWKTLFLTSIGEREMSQFVIMADARRLMQQYPELRTSVQNVAAISGAGARAQAIQFNVRGPDLKELERYTEAIKEKMRGIDGLLDIDATLNVGKPELQVVIDREKAADLGVSVTDIATSLRSMVGGDEEITRYREGDDEYQVRLRVDGPYRGTAEAISALSVPSSKGGLVRLDNVVNLVEATGPAQIERQNRQRQVTILANLEPTKPLGAAMDDVAAATKELNMGPAYSTGFTGRGKVFAESMKGFVIAFVLSLIFMYMVLAAQFENFIHPITIMLSIPLSIPFALMSLIVTAGSLNLYAILGLFLLFGIVKKNAILQVDYTNTLRAEGMRLYDAIIEANRARLRPILMTTATLVAGMLPMALLTSGPGAASRSSMANVIVGGQMLCLLITLLITPVAYTYFDALTRWFFRIIGSEKGNSRSELTLPSGITDEPVPQPGGGGAGGA